MRLACLITIGTLLVALIRGEANDDNSSQETTCPVTAICFAPADSVLVYASQAGVFLRSSDATTRALGTELDHIHDLKFSSDGKLLAVAGGEPAKNGRVEIWDWKVRKRLATLSTHADVVYSVVWLKNNDTIASASADRLIHLTDINTGEKIVECKGHSGPVLALAYLADQDLLVSGSADHTIRVWNATKGDLLRSLTNHLGPVHALAFRPKLPERPIRYLASASSDGTVRIWQPSIGRMVRIIRPPALIGDISWSQGGDILYAGDRKGDIHCIDGDSDEILQKIPIEDNRILSLTTSSSGQHIGVGTTKSIKVRSIPEK